MVCEFQHGTTMIYVEYGENYPMDKSLADARKTIDLALDEADCVLAYASAISASRHPDFWKNANRIPLRQRPLKIFSIRYLIASGFPIYEISWEPRFEAEYGTAYSEDWVEESVLVEVPKETDFLKIRRLSPYQYEHVD
jgi:hypothetical protein